MDLNILYMVIGRKAMKIPKIQIGSPKDLFFTADPHFFHRRVIEYCQRPFSDAEEMTEALINNWNSVVPKNGQVFVLGDMFWVKHGRERCKEVMDRLNGRKWLVAGNHDYFSPEAYREIGFEDAVDYLDVNVQGQRVMLFHYPVERWNGWNRGYWHLHGHVHGRGNPAPRRMDVGVDCNNYFPFSWEQIAERLSCCDGQNGEKS